MTFDATAFMNQTVDAPMATYVAPPPEGECLARVGSEEDDVKIESFPGKKDPSKTYVRVTLMWDVVDEAYKALAGRETIRIRDQFLLDIDDVTNQIKTGPEDNVALGQRREALGLNTSMGFSLSQLRGAGPAMIRIKHRADDRDPQRKYAEIGRVVKMG